VQLALLMFSPTCHGHQGFHALNSSHFWH
jgi:hypothetical protein